MRLNLEPRVRRLEKQIRLRSRNDDDRLRLRLSAADQRMARYPSTEAWEINRERMLRDSAEGDAAALE